MDGLMYRGLLKILNKPHKDSEALTKELLRFLKPWRVITIHGERPLINQ